MKHAQRTEKYIRLIFNSYISGDFQGQEGVHIMHQYALCNPKYGMPNQYEFSEKNQNM